jgi:hypothetical protein
VARLPVNGIAEFRSAFAAWDKSTVRRLRRAYDLVPATEIVRQRMTQDMTPLSQVTPRTVGKCRWQHQVPVSPHQSTHSPGGPWAGCSVKADMPDVSLLLADGYTLPVTVHAK